MNRLASLQANGQSYWLDNLTRHMIANGDLGRRIREEGLGGITANPTTFGQALGTDDYDEDIGNLSRQGMTTREIFECLLITDVQYACDLLRGVHRDTGGLEGFVSLEVSPHLAHDTEGTMEEARHYVATVNRPNLLIKIPGTSQGVVAIEQMLHEGVSINVTLLFSVGRYEAVMEAYLSALERRLAKGMPLNSVLSVASFFLSRIDVLVDLLLEQRLGRGEGSAARLRGQAAIANAKLAYQTFKRVKAGDRWQRLIEKGARAQRLLWASTGTKNPALRDVYYVEQLIGRDTINTMTEQTIQAFADHGEVRPDAIEQGVEEAKATVRELEDIGIGLNSVAGQLEQEGIQKFIDAYDAALQALEHKRRQMVSKAAA